jgi:hypothetical protein
MTKIYTLENKVNPQYPYIVGTIYEEDLCYRFEQVPGASIDEDFRNLKFKTSSYESMVKTLMTIAPHLHWIEHLVIRFHQDCGHGWYEVEQRVLDHLGISDSISGFSYRKDTKVYCEEDCDAHIFFSTLEKNKGYSYDVISAEYFENSPIRTYKPYTKKDFGNVPF